MTEDSDEILSDKPFDSAEKALWEEIKKHRLQIERDKVRKIMELGGAKKVLFIIARHNLIYKREQKQKKEEEEREKKARLESFSNDIEAFNAKYPKHAIDLQYKQGERMNTRGQNRNKPLNVDYVTINSPNGQIFVRIKHPDDIVLQVKIYYALKCANDVNVTANADRNNVLDGTITYYGTNIVIPDYFLLKNSDQAVLWLQLMKIRWGSTILVDRLFSATNEYTIKGTKPKGFCDFCGKRIDGFGTDTIASGRTWNDTKKNYELANLWMCLECQKQSVDWKADTDWIRINSETPTQFLQPGNYRRRRLRDNLGVKIRL